MPDFVLVQAKSFLQISLKSGLNTEFLQFSVAKKATKTSVFRRKNKQKWGILWVQLSSVPPSKMIEVADKMAAKDTESKNFLAWIVKNKEYVIAGALILGSVILGVNIKGKGIPKLTK